MKAILIYFVLFNLNAFLLTFIILGICFFGKLFLCKKSWTDFFRDLTMIRASIFFLLGAMIFGWIAYQANYFFFDYFNLDPVFLLAISIPCIQIILFLLLMRKGKQYLMKGEAKQIYETIYK